MKGKKLAVLGSAVGALVIAGALAAPAFAVSDPEDNAADYSYSAGQQSNADIQAKYGYSDTDTVTNPDYSFNTGRAANASRKAAFAELPEDAAKEEAEAFYESHDVGGSPAYSDGEYDETAKEGYSYSKGRTSYQQWHSAFEENV